MSHRAPDNLEQPSPFRISEDLKGYRAAASQINNIAEEHRRFHCLEPIVFMLLSHSRPQHFFDDRNVCPHVGYRSAEAIKRRGESTGKRLNLAQGYLGCLPDRNAHPPDSIQEPAIPCSVGEAEEPMDWLEPLLLQPFESRLRPQPKKHQPI